MASTRSHRTDIYRKIAQKQESQENEKKENDKPKEEPQSWNIFRVIPRERKGAEEPFEPIVKFLKVLMYFLMLAVFLGAIVTSKVSFLLLTSLLKVHEDKPELIDNNIKLDRNTTATLIVILLLVPNILSLLVFSARALFGKQEKPTLLKLIMILLIDALPCTAGLCLFALRVLPQLDMIQGLLLMNTVCVVPALLKIFFCRSPYAERPDYTVLPGQKATSKCFKECSRHMKNLVWYIIHIIALVFQVGAFVFVSILWHEVPALRDHFHNETSNSSLLFFEERGKMGSTLYYEAGLSVFLISFTWWENFVDKDFEIKGKKFGLKKLKAYMHETRHKSSIWISLFTSLIILASPFVLLKGFQFELNSHPYRRNKDEQVFLDYSSAIVQGLSAIVAYYTGILICKLCMQKVSFNIPLVLATPLTLLFLIYQCFFDDLIQGKRYIWVCGHYLNLNVDDIWLYLPAIAWWVSQLIICGYIWYPQQNRMEKTDRLFVRPLYVGPLLEQSMMLNRRHNDLGMVFSEAGNLRYVEESDSDKLAKVKLKDGEFDGTVPHVIACATMWHETRNEMTQLLKSIFRMDVHNCVKRIAKDCLEIEDKDYYDFETHILFDDAFQRDPDNKDVYITNDYVKTFCEEIDKAGSSILRTAVEIEPPTLMDTPYGGRLTWTLPGGTKVYCHLKDKNKIRHRKRWSQVMYMFYLLGYKLMGRRDEFPKEDKKNNKHKNKAGRIPILRQVPEALARKAENTYLLALDGDVDFKPDAVRLLIDMMKKNSKVGAACGRIHPIGSGPLVWYQAFEYAIGHWLQKAAEHVFGCVLCSPGCFSLFRASAIMDDNVMETYTKKAEEAHEYVQYDQGEDRWLCTLLLQQGYKVEYNAASDALTYCPEGFSEFFNQRRRWGPSTMANIIDLLSSYQSTVEKNTNISMIYVVYVFLLMISTILGPATIIMMIAGSFNSVLGTNLWHSFIMSIEPPVFYLIVCMTLKSNIQLQVAMAMCTMYSGVMSVVIVGTIINAVTESITSPNVIFLLGLTCFFIAAALLHPQEFFCIVHGFLYFLLIPSGYLLLMIYSLCNLHVVSWGTRETAVIKTKEELEEEKREEEERRKKEMETPKGLIAWLGLSGFMNDLKEFYGTMLGRKTSVGGESNMREELKSMNTHLETLVELVGKNSGNKPATAKPKTPTSPKGETKISMPQPDSGSDKKEPQVSSLLVPIDTGKVKEAEKLKKHSDSLKKPHTWKDSEIFTGKNEYLNKKEEKFWNEFIDEFLLPLDENPQQQKKIAGELIELRNKIVFAFFLTNMLWITIVFILQVMKDTLEDGFFLAIPRADDPDGDPEKFEPLSLLFLLFFAVILTLQFIGTVIHRLGTFFHIIAITEITSPFGRHTKHVHDIKNDILGLGGINMGSEGEPEADYGDDEELYDDIGNMNDLDDRDTPPTSPDYSYSRRPSLNNITAGSDRSRTDYTTDDNRSRRPSLNDITGSSRSRSHSPRPSLTPSTYGDPSPSSGRRSSRAGLDDSSTGERRDERRERHERHRRRRHREQQDGLGKRHVGGNFIQANFQRNFERQKTTKGKVNKRHKAMYDTIRNNQRKYHEMAKAQSEAQRQAYGQAYHYMNGNAPYNPYAAMQNYA